MHRKCVSENSIKPKNCETHSRVISLICPALCRTRLTSIFGVRLLRIISFALNAGTAVHLFLCGLGDTPPLPGLCLILSWRETVSPSDMRGNTCNPENLGSQLSGSTDGRALTPSGDEGPRVSPSQQPERDNFSWGSFCTSSHAFCAPDTLKSCPSTHNLHASCQKDLSPAFLPLASKIKQVPPPWSLPPEPSENSVLLPLYLLSTSQRTALISLCFVWYFAVKF